MNAGAFSDEGVVAATQKVIPVLVDCSEKGSNAALMDTYDVQGFPTVVYADPEGKKLKEMGSRDAGPISGEVNALATKYPGRPSLWQNSVKGALAAAKKLKNPVPVAVYIADEKADFVKLLAKLTKELGSKAKKALFVIEVGAKPKLEARGVEAAPAALVLDPTAEDPSKEPLAKVALEADAKPTALEKAIDEAAKKLKATKK